MIPTYRTFAQSEIEFGEDGGYHGIYDGVIIWHLKDGTVVNRFAGIEGYGDRAQRIEDLIDRYKYVRAVAT